MSKLVAEKRINKNGVAVTKYVNVDGKSPVKRTAIPAPSAHKQITADVLSAVKDALNRKEHGFDDLRPRPEIYRRAKQLPESVMSAYLQAIEDRPEIGYADMLAGLLSLDASDKMIAYSLVVTQMDQLSYQAEDGDKGYFLYDMASATYGGLALYATDGIEFDITEDILNPDDPDAARMRGLMDLTIRLSNSGSRYVRSVQTDDDGVLKITSPDLVNVVLDHPQESTRIAEFIINRPDASAAEIEALVEGVMPALIDGAL